MSPCPSERQLEQLLDEQLADSEKRAVSEHVSECAECQRALERLTDTTEVSGVSLARARRPGNGVGPDHVRWRQPSEEASCAMLTNPA